ncbi:1-aminocyclopropane-1-carboxylate deaminase/D-cysteine desulfhydrase [Campylobacter sp. MIT 21-1685]|uniref:1-aminocyclopropane-1-carboxylate deaminase/D-cysteine desulfhydrase n=1 Tax=unclassified Campylobacter TaxID=2593542 RepID=UPI00224A929F|nr:MULTISPECIES: 1-aminocyclopropane-1-carboxylate deaminase/D-cysteine desulfhydrase [unclassified Campylobacter]MCX2682345.1 1-aminocyclopropane-1-carboxylate deaminase/D-cysteine desulfhydrase [Campylobacter sp. MIT 21-1684]MCX2750625.1 1-aminocyclopropane-1-carboxylate deaminase/D-cysteine desulfhydrase [Campylobacter sp. MIT 21-1682]MCX2806827.1 1-aminocyclopropane-1-carboxylate deaminase/D-cysteine desulfhydrase [Campylobacter sp. MIT 21-1685]
MKILQLNLPSPIQKLSFRGFDFFLKRDDLLGSINGNKARKLSFYMTQHYTKNQSILSYGGAQSNALAALSIFSKAYALNFRFVCKKIPTFLKHNPCANYALALKNGAQFVENTSNKSNEEFALSLYKQGDIFIKEGIANEQAQWGFKILANEIEEQSNGLDFDIFLPSGTGVSAAFLAKYSKFRVFTCACVGPTQYLKKQIQNLLPEYNFSNLFFLEPTKKYHFAKPYAELIALYKELQSVCGVEFDLLYDMIGFHCVLRHKWNKPLLYIHQGGILGNESMIERYKFKTLLD